MTGKELLSMACHLFFEPNTGYYEPFALSHINTLLSDAFEVNNRLREYADKEKFPEIPALSGLGEELPYEDSLTRGAFPYGLASKLYFDENDPGGQSVFHQQYVAAVQEADRGYVRVRGDLA